MLSFIRVAAFLITCGCHCISAGRDRSLTVGVYRCGRMVGWEYVCQQIAWMRATDIIRAAAQDGA